MRALLHRPSPAMVVAITALVFASTGGAVAAVSSSSSPSAAHKKPPSDSSADKKLVKQLAPSLSVKFAKTAATASTATNANHATTAGSATTVAGQSLRHIGLAVLSDGTQKFLTFGQVKLNFGCPGGLVNVTASNAGTQTAAFESGFISNNPLPVAAHQTNDENFTSGDADTLGSGGSGTGQTDVSFANGTVTTFEYGFQDNGQTGGHGCRFFGRGITG